VGPALFIPQWCQQEMHMIWHYGRSMKGEALPVIMQTVLEYGVSGGRREWVSIILAKCDEECSSRFLVVGQLATVFIHPVEARVGRTLLSAAFAFGFHTSIALFPAFCVCDE
jgi:hypothetical protein